jgi:hypothetical protein
MADAFPTDAGAVLRMHVLRVSVGGCLEPTAGGVSLTVIGTLSGDRMDKWRAGRIVRATATLRRPARYLDEGVPDLERMKWYGYFSRKNHDFDHYMCRVRIPGCEMNATQARALALIAHQSGHGLVDLTTRGNVQIQGLKKPAAPSDDKTEPVTTH